MKIPKKIFAFIAETNQKSGEWDVKNRLVNCGVAYIRDTELARRDEALLKNIATIDTTLPLEDVIIIVRLAMWGLDK